MAELEGYRDFLTPEFDAIHYASKVIQGTDIATSLAQLSIGIDSLNKQLQQQIVLHNDDLLRQVTGIDELDDVLNLARGGLDTLQMSMSRLHDKIRDPYQQIVLRTQQLEQLQLATELLRQFLRYLFLSKRLRVHLQVGEQDISKAAQCLNEIGGLLKDSSLMAVDVVKAERAWIDRAHHIVIGQADRMLSDGLGTSQNHADVGTALQVFHNLEQLPHKVSSILQNVNTHVAAEIKKALDVKTLGADAKDTAAKAGALGGIRRVGEPTAGQAPAWASVLWQRLEKLMDTFVVSAQQIILLERVLSRKRDPSTHSYFLDDVLKMLNATSLVSSFWTFLSESLERELTHAVKHSAFLQSTFQTDFPKLVRLLQGFFQRINTILNATAAPGSATSASGRVDDVHSPEQQMLRRALSGLETAYLQRSLSRMFDPINIAFPMGGSGGATPGAPASVSKAPTRPDVVVIVKIMTSELEAVSFDPLLLRSIAKNVANAVKLFAVKSESTMDTQPSSFAISAMGQITETQVRNIETLNALYTIYDLVIGTSSATTDNVWHRHEVIESLQDALKSVQQLIQGVIEPILQAIADAVEQVLALMHKEDFSVPAPPSTPKDPTEAPCSKYMRDACHAVQHLHQTYLARMDCGSDMKTWVNTLASYLLTAFVRHLSIVRPLGEGGKLRMAADMAQFELGLGPLFTSTGQTIASTGRAYKALRAFRPLLFLESSQVVAKHHRNDLELAVVAHHLIVRASSELQLPHVRSGWTPSEYVAWLDTHSPEEVQAMINTSLTAYAAEVLKRGLKSYTPEYPLLMKLLQPDTATTPA